MQDKVMPSFRMKNILKKIYFFVIMGRHFSFICVILTAQKRHTSTSSRNSYEKAVK